MFCINCGEQLPDNAKFCMKCGTKLSNIGDNTASDMSISSFDKSSTIFVPAKCTNCGGTLQVNPEEKTAVCKYCNSNFLVDQAVKNYNIHVNGNISIGSATINIRGENVQNLVARAVEFERESHFNNAIEYYNKVLDIDINNVEAKEGLARVNQKLKNYMYIRVEIPCISSSNEIIEVYKTYILHTKGNDKKKYEISKIINIKQPHKNLMTFEIEGDYFSNVSIAAGDETSAIVEFILNAQKGIYPNIG
ncbi:zinc ribbon domain-containing protein [Anaerovibrio lipolyticus]|uniref:zinc ribbon domain-containing protein n=1 Tax=Anaerovibrio lipolyticus TaxID=82374 RepID=UPI00047F1568|nr:zinc ribbon domain-containing protein [Anaerovibrio lipolyticus]